jgi:DNA-binding IclR family transcriptional regulator
MKTARASRRSPRKSGTVQSVERAFDILYAFSLDQPQLSAADLGKRLGLSRPTVYRLLDTLISKGIVRRVGKPQNFALDIGVAKLAHVWFGQVDSINASRPIATAVRDDMKETVAVFVLQGTQRLCVVEARSHHPLSVTRGVGHFAPAWSGASGKAILAHVDEQTLRAVLAKLPTEVTEEKLRRELASVRRNGFAISRGEIYVGAVGVAAPFFDYMGYVAGSLGVFAPEARFGRENIEIASARVRQACAQLSTELGNVSNPRAAIGRDAIAV